MLCISVLFKVRMVCRKLRSWLNRCKVDGLIKEATNQSKCWFFNKSQKSKDSGGKQQVTTKLWALAHYWGNLVSNLLKFQCNVEPLTHENFSYNVETSFMIIT